MDAFRNRSNRREALKKLGTLGIILSSSGSRVRADEEGSPPACGAFDPQREVYQVDALCTSGSPAEYQDVDCGKISGTVSGTGAHDYHGDGDCQDGATVRTVCAAWSGRAGTRIVGSPVSARGVPEGQ